jgi:hypothetical protein
MPEPMFTSTPEPDGSTSVHIPPQAMQGMSPIAMIGLVTAIVRAAPAIMALWPQVMAIVDKIKPHLPPSMGNPPP